MIKFDKEKNQLILHLRKLHNLKDKTAYSDLKKALCKKYGVTVRTVENWLNRRNPGQRKSRSDAGFGRKPEKRSDKKKAMELLESGKKIKDIKKSLGKNAGRKLERIRTEYEANDLIDNNQGEELVSNFGDEAKSLFDKLFQLNLIAPDRGVGIKFNGHRFIIPKDDISDISLILANAYNRVCGDKDKLKLDRRQLLRQKIFHLIEQQVRLANEHIDSKTVESITRMYDRMLEQTKLDADILVIEKVCKSLKPDITFDEIISLIGQYSETNG